MRVFGINQDGTFREFVKTAFDLDHQEAVLEEWLEANPDGFLDDDKVLIIGRQVTTNLGGFVDLVGLDREGNVVVVELKRDRTPRDTLAQALEYASFAEQLDAEHLEAILQKYTSDEGASLTEHHRRYFELDADTAVAFNKDQRIVIVGQRITPEIRQTARYLGGKGLQVTCVEFTFFETDVGQKLLSHEIVVGKEATRPKKVSSGSLPVVTEQQFLDSTDQFGRPVFEKLLKFAHAEGLPLHWGAKGFSMNVDIDGTHVPICFGYPSTAQYGQTVTSAFVGQGGMKHKSNLSDDELEQLRQLTVSTGLFSPSGQDFKCPLERALKENEVEQLIAWLGDMVHCVVGVGLRE